MWRHLPDADTEALGAESRSAGRTPTTTRGHTMSTAATAHHRISDPIAMAAAVAVIIGGAAVIGVAASQSETTPPVAPAAPRHGKVPGSHPGPSRVGMGDFAQNQQQGSGNARLHGGHATVSEP